MFLAFLDISLIGKDLKNYRNLIIFTIIQEAPKYDIKEDPSIDKNVKTWDNRNIFLSFVFILILIKEQILRGKMATGIVTQTKLWDLLQKKSWVNRTEDIASIECACKEAEDLLTRIPDTFPTYTLHDATHSRNICDIMFNLLGEDGREKLTVIEIALLILSAFYHDIGMVYEEGEKMLC